MRVHHKPYDTSHMRAGILHRFTDGFQTDAMSILRVYPSTDTLQILADAGGVRRRLDKGSKRQFQP